MFVASLLFTMGADSDRIRPLMQFVQKIKSLKKIKRDVVLSLENQLCSFFEKKMEQVKHVNHGVH